MKIKSFTLLETIFVIVIIGIFATFAIPKLSEYLNFSKLVKIKSEVNSIQNALNIVYEKGLLKNASYSYPTTLDNAPTLKSGEELFVGTDEVPLLEVGLDSSDEDKKDLGKWIKLSDTTYKIYLSTTEFITLEYFNETGKFDCIDEDEKCKEILK